MKKKILTLLVLLVAAVSGAWAQGSDPAPIELTSTDGKTWTLASMPAYDVELEVEYKADLTLTVNIEGWTFGATANTPTVSGNEGSGAVTFEYKKKGAADDSYSTDVPTDAGEYTVRATVAETDDYVDGTATADFTIAKAAATISYETASVSKAYGDADFTNDLTNTGNGTVTYTSNNESVATVNSETGLIHIVGSGEATITATVVDGTNYTYATKTAQYTLTVEAAQVITVGATGYATYCSTHDLDFTDSDAKAYIVSAFTPSTAQVILTRIYDVKAGTGIIVKAPEGSYEIPCKAAETIVSNMLVGVTESTVLNKVDGDYTNYVLAKKNDLLGFYTVVDGSILGANKAYLPLLTSSLPAAAEVKLMLVFDDEGLATGIETPEKQEGAESAVYNLNGQRMSRLQKGVNIVGGKKVFIK